jgi:hypothetical protein
MNQAMDADLATSTRLVHRLIEMIDRLVGLSLS